MVFYPRFASGATRLEGYVVAVEAATRWERWPFLQAGHPYNWDMTTVQEDLKLMRPCVELRDDFLAMCGEYVRQGNTWERGVFGEAQRDFPRYLRRVDEIADGVNLPPGWVPQYTYWLVRSGRQIVAVSHFRPNLHERGLYEEGHIGYGTRPSQRGKGYATMLCRLTLLKARELGLRRVLITCDADNVASARVIERNGGQLENQVPSRETGKLKSRYWVELDELSPDF